MQNSTVNKKQPSDAKTIVTITLKLLVIGVVTALLLAVVNELTKDKIAENTAKVKQTAISELFPGGFDISPYEGTLPADSGVNDISVVRDGNTYVGYVAEVAPKGFGGEITLMVGVNFDGSVNGVKLISHSETAGLGSRVGDTEYLSKYIGANKDNVLGVDTISGATISSKAVRAGVATALSVHDAVKEAGGAQ